MSAPVLFEFIKPVGHEIKCEACQSFYHFCKEFNKFNNTGAQMLDYMYIIR